MAIELTTAPEMVLSGIRSSLKVPKSDTTGIPSASAVTNIIMISQLSYDAIPVKDPTTLYVIIG